jgi:hypothetical protein
MGSASRRTSCAARGPEVPGFPPRSQQHAKVVPWMRKTEYISTEFNRYGISNEKPEVKYVTGGRRKGS